MRLVLLSLWHRLGQKFYAFNSPLKRSKRIQSHPQMGDYNSIRQNPRSSGDGIKANRLNSDICDAAVEAKVGCAVEIDERSICARYGRNTAGDTRYLLNGDWQRRVGFVGHDGSPWIWDEEKHDWVNIRGPEAPEDGMIRE